MICVQGENPRTIFLVIPDIGNRESILVSFGWNPISRRHCAVDSVDKFMNQDHNQKEICRPSLHALAVCILNG